MRVTKLQALNFKSLQKLDLDIYNALNVIIGKNDAGKTNIFSALRIAFSAEIVSQRLKVKSENLLESVYEGDWTHEFFDSRKPYADITIQMKISKRTLERWGLKPNSDESSKLVLSRTIRADKDKLIVAVEFLRLDKDIIIGTPDEGLRFRSADGTYQHTVEKTIGEQILLALKKDFLLLSANRLINREVGGSKVDVQQYIENALMELANSGDEENIRMFANFNKFISELSPMINTIELVRDEKNKITKMVFKSDKGEAMPLSTIGSGNNELLMMLHEIVLSAGKVLAIEEPEIHLHPEAKRKLYRFMKTFSSETQIFIITHESIFVQPDNINALFRVIRRGMKTEVLAMNTKDYIDKDRLMQELNAENCEMFFADKVLLVEGISDKIMMEGLLERHCKSTAEIKVVTAYSKDNFEVYIELLKIFKIDYLILTDLDALKGKLKIKPIETELRGQTFKTREEQIAYLKKKKIYVLSKGALEQSYPPKYHRGISKPLDALYALYEMTDVEYHSPLMADLRGVIELLEK